MTLLSRVVSRALHLPPATVRQVARERDLRAVMPDGVELLANRWYPADRPQGEVTVLMRTPYGRSGPWAFEAPLLAERGFNVIVQSCRGTHGSGGEFEPFRNEHADGLATLAWMQEQPWFDGRLATYGSSYCGFTQHAMANGAPDGLIGAMAAFVAPADIRAVFYPFGVLSLESITGWVAGNDAQRKGYGGQLLSLLKRRERRQRVAEVLPMSDADTAAMGHPDAFFQGAVAHPDLDDPWWHAFDQRPGLLTAKAPMTVHAGWFDLFAPYMLDDLQQLLASGRDVEFTIGPWNHGGGFGGRLRDAVALFDRELKGRETPRRVKPVHVQLHGDPRWWHFDTWPPPAAVESWYLQPGGGLAPEPPVDSAPDSYTYDPLDPAPSIGGAALDKGGPADNTDRESRADVLTYTSAPLASDLTVLGPVRAQIHTTSTTPWFDVVVRLCDVDDTGVSRNLSDGLVRVENGTGLVDVELWPVGAVFRRGHRIRLQVASAMHPLYARNLGSGVPYAAMTEATVSRHEVFHDPDRPSRIDLPCAVLTEADLR